MNVNGVVVCSGARLFNVLQESFGEPLVGSVCDGVVRELKKVINDE
jgi:hypothetical protein